MFTDVEKAILSQLSYCDTQPNTDLATYLNDHKAYLEGKLKFSSGNGYAEAYEKLVEKANKNTYTVVAAENDPKTGFAAFAVAGPNHEVTVACRGTEFDKLLSEETKKALQILKDHGITDLRLTVSTVAILEAHGITGDGLTDVLADIELAFGQESAQQRKMEAFVEELEKENYNGYHFIGHSLGGNISMHGAITMQDPTLLKSVVTFNSPGYNLEYLQAHEGNIASIRGKTKCYQNKKDPVSEALYVPGNVIILEGADPEASGFDPHMLFDLVVSDDSFQYSSRQNKETTVLGLVFLHGSHLGNLINATNPMDVKENSWNFVKSWKGTTINVPLSTLQENARIMQDLADTNADIFDRVYNSLLCLRGSGQWQGVALEAIVVSTEANKKKFADTIAEMKALADFLNKFTREIKEKDIQIKNQINAV